MEKEYIDLLVLQSLIKAGLEETFPGKVWVRAEISSVSVKPNGHCYLDLTQDNGSGTVARARAVIWKSKYLMLDAFFRQATGGPLKAGITILAHVQISYSELYGLSLTIDDLDAAATVGQKELERRRTIERLQAEGLMDMQKTLELAQLPYSLAIISAGGAAGLGDFLNHLHGNPYGFAFHTVLYEATMQGEKAPESITDAFERIQASGELYDAVLLLRGGGSASDLECFDDYGIAFSIANCPYPVFTAIGHDRDHHIADMVAFGYVKTPTALADEFLDCFASEDQRIEEYAHRLKMAFIGKINLMSGKLDMLEARIKAADPRNILSRGYLLATDTRGVVVKSVRAVNVGDEMKIMFGDGVLDCKVIEKHGTE